ncbi:4-hydroxythreonine-4-phosphate dehydrogenase [Rubripirellula lacrimiformis]|uniref:4-hydroxythreonine-4-phosphate dehydrogenase n=1 Tax=Rubripirellula lacrimiformis TaxID=1930273 RepID=A0A517NHD0_9BACT|nr:4-hydroxythreonine-4-phosphate dehydrogenase PdxA [Rubripirellula lacrimiformis]QDT06488.1 4-hydroxythreonine-4-phosphate dehydrogenase [Rubripirellula lacrimiformis]
MPEFSKLPDPNASGPPARRLPRIAITVGDVAGVGPELAIRCAALAEVTQRCEPILYGPQAVIDRIADQMSLQRPTRVLDIGKVDAAKVCPGKFDAVTGQASFDAFDRGVADAIAGRIDAVVTGPIQKEAWYAAGIRFPGHTEVLADRTGTDDACMMLTGDAISCVLATIHIPLADVAQQLTTESIVRAIRLGNDAITRRNGRPARVTVCGLNPHAGENGLFSHGEEERVIIPAIEIAKQDGILVTGPLPPDTAFTPAMRSATDVYVCMYHDQGLIPLKALCFDDAVNVTLGLPMVRTSVDHGTAMDIAWQGKANHHSMLAAIRMAIDLSDDA